LCVSVPISFAELETVLPFLGGDGVDAPVDGLEGADLVVGGRVLAHDPLVGVRVAGIALVRADRGGQFGGAPVGDAGHQRRDRRRERPPAVGVVGVTGRHQQGTQVGVPDAQLPKGPRVRGDLVRREVREGDRDVHRGDDELGQLDEPIDIEAAVPLQELHQIN
jgi:hypothetical protein